MSEDRLARSRGLGRRRRVIGVAQRSGVTDRAALASLSIGVVAELLAEHLANAGDLGPEGFQPWEVAEGDAIVRISKMREPHDWSRSNRRPVLARCHATGSSGWKSGPGEGKGTEGSNGRRCGLIGSRAAPAFLLCPERLIDRTNTGTGTGPLRQVVKIERASESLESCVWSPSMARSWSCIRPASSSPRHERVEVWSTGIRLGIRTG